jgi:hypothetical protein
LRIILASFACFAVITAALAPVTWFFTVQMSDSTSTDSDRLSHATLLFGHTKVVAVAGVLANLQAFRRLLHVTTSATAALRTFFCWTVGNLFVGAQVGWVMRPYVASPGIPVEFLRADPFDGTFYESVFASLRHLVGSGGMAWLFLINVLLWGGFIAWAALSSLVKKHQTQPNP